MCAYVIDECTFCVCRGHSGSNPTLACLGLLTTSCIRRQLPKRPASCIADVTSMTQRAEGTRPQSPPPRVGLYTHTCTPSLWSSRKIRSTHNFAIYRLSQTIPARGETPTSEIGPRRPAGCTNYDAHCRRRRRRTRISAGAATVTGGQRLQCRCFIKIGAAS